ncbi:MAG TPA: hypothetical protein EYQ75_07855, partial [Planctomycetaceae bacterium]|nr:hypothetical protein [Planctomycetaceae bacterium]
EVVPIAEEFVDELPKLIYALDEPLAGPGLFPQYAVSKLASEKVTGRVESTGSWDNYRQAKIGTVQLKQGHQRVLFQSAGKPSNFLVDLREVCLVPIRQPPPDPFRTDDGARKPKRVEGNKPSVVRP